ncbi:MAG: hypothetical protein H6R46_154 [Proteobacteria bacterium]|nr:hypothetical protein [Pseudomonadota bacterium]
MRAVLQTIGMIFYPLLVHLLILYKVPAVAVAGLVATSLVYFYTMLHLRAGPRLRFVWVGVYALLAAVGSLNLLTNTVYALYLPPLLINSGLMILFGLTLRHASMPLVERLMRMEYPGVELPEALVRYARNLTRVWTGYFAGIVLISLVLAVGAPLELWSLFANVLSYFFAVLLFLAQYGWRALRYRQYGLFMPWDTLRCIARVSPHDRAQLLFYGRPGQG